MGRIAYRKLVQMNMPVDDENKVNFTSTLMAIIRTSLGIKMPVGGRFKDRLEMDEELRDVIRETWPEVEEEQLKLLVPSLDEAELTVGKIYGSLLIYDHWKASKDGATGLFGGAFAKLVKQVIENNKQ